MTYIDKLAWLEIKDKKLLMTLSKGKDKWYIPGGKRENKESDRQALTREIKEELSVDIDPNSLQAYGIFEAQAHGKPPGTIVRMTCYMATYTGKLKVDAEIEKMEYFSYSMKNLSSVVDNLIFDDLKKNRLIE